MESPVTEMECTSAPFNCSKLSFVGPPLSVTGLQKIKSCDLGLLKSMQDGSEGPYLFVALSNRQALTGWQHRHCGGTAGECHVPRPLDKIQAAF